MNKLSELFKQPTRGMVEKVKNTMGVKLRINRFTKHGRRVSYLNNVEIVNLLRLSFTEGVMLDETTKLPFVAFDEWLSIMREE